MEVVVEEYIISEILSKAFPIVWPVLSLVLFGKTVFCFVKNKYHDAGLYECDADGKISGIAFVATIIFMLFSVFDITGLAELCSNRITVDPITNLVFSYVLRWAIASVIDFLFCSIAWYIYLRQYIGRSVYS